MGKGGIDIKDISVVVQGAVDPVNTALALKGLRKHLHGAEIIVSAWEGTNVEGLTYDKVILNKDPGGVTDNRGWVNNLNRQLVSTQNGLKQVKRKYALKMRSDLVFKSHGFIKYWNRFPKREEEFMFFKERVIFCSMFFKRYVGQIKNKVMPVPFHISDWMMFGLTEDLNKLFNIDLAQEPEFTNYLNKHKVNTLKPNVLGASHRYTPEQYIMYSAITKQSSGNNNSVRFSHMLDYTSDNITCSERFTANNCIILEPWQFAFYCAKQGDIDPYMSYTKGMLGRFKIPYDTWEGLYGFSGFCEDYKGYCDKDFNIPSYIEHERKRYLRFHGLFARRGADER